MKIFVSAAEISSDIHAEKILRALIESLKKQAKTAEIIGIGGPRLRSIAGFECITHAESMRAMGLVEVLGKLFHIRKVLNQTVKRIEEFNPDLILTFDYPEFHLQLMKKIKNQIPHALKICGIPPKVWVWRSHRVEKLRALYDGVWVILPFEKAFYESHGIPVIYEGNPLIAALFESEVESQVESQGQEEMQAGVPLKMNPLVLTVMPGSREAELKYHLPIIPETLRLIAKKNRTTVHALVPLPTGISFERVKTALVSDSEVSYEFIIDGSKQCLRKTSMGLIKSGTSTLEAAVLGCVPVIFYQGHGFSVWFFHQIVRYLGPVGLPNILLGIKNRGSLVFPEFLGKEATPEALSNEVTKWIKNPVILQEKQQRGRELKVALLPHEVSGGTSSRMNEKIAEALLSWSRVKPYKTSARKKSILIRLGSFSWSLLNFLRRRVYRLGVLRSVSIETPSILVGNIQAGGSGKTPVVIELAREATKNGKRVAVVSRGYRSQAENEVRIVLPEEKISTQEVGDEPVEIRKSVPQVILGIGSDRVQVVKKLERQFPAVDLIIFDDGFQNLKFKPSFTVLMRTTRGPAEVFYRDFRSELKFADAVILKEDLQWQPAEQAQMPVWILCGVASPESVAAFYSQQGYRVERFISKRDHARFELGEVNNLMKEAALAGAILAVTEKDFVKISELGIGCYPDLSSIRQPDPNRVGVLKRKLLSKDWIPASLFDKLKE